MLLTTDVHFSLIMELLGPLTYRHCFPSCSVLFHSAHMDCGGVWGDDGLRGSGVGGWIGEERETGENDTKIQRRNRKYLSSQVCIRHVYL